MFKDVNEALNSFYFVVHNLIQNLVPLKKCRISRFPRWFSSELIRLVRLKKQLHAKYKSTNDNVDYIEFSHIRSLCKYESKQCYNRYVSQAENAINSDPRSFWRFLRSRNGLEGILGAPKFAEQRSSTLLSSH
jgi:hypothetical protein